MSEMIEILLPEPAAAKLFELRSLPENRQLISNIETQLAYLHHSGCRFAMAPPVPSSAGGACDLIVRELRMQISIIAGSLIYLGKGKADDVKSSVFIAALTIHLLKLEREEEAAIALAAADGVFIKRRSDADPRAVLGLVEIEPAEA